MTLFFFLLILKLENLARESAKKSFFSSPFTRETRRQVPEKRRKNVRPTQSVTTNREDAKLMDVETFTSSRSSMGVLSQIIDKKSSPEVVHLKWQHVDVLWVKLCQRQTFAPGTSACRLESLTVDKQDEISVDSLEWMFERLTLATELVK